MTSIDTAERAKALRSALSVAASDADELRVAVLGERETAKARMAELMLEISRKDIALGRVEGLVGEDAVARICDLETQLCLAKDQLEEAQEALAARRARDADVRACLEYCDEDDPTIPDGIGETARELLAADFLKGAE